MDIHNTVSLNLRLYGKPYGSETVGALGDDKWNKFVEVFALFPFGIRQIIKSP